MNHCEPTLSNRAERFRPAPAHQFDVLVGDCAAALGDISRTGLSCLVPTVRNTLPPGTRLESLRLRVDQEVIDCGPARIVRAEVISSAQLPAGTHYGIAFDQSLPALLHRLSGSISPYEYVTEELAAARPTHIRVNGDPTQSTLDEFYSDESTDLFSKCHTFGTWVSSMVEQELYQRFYRVTLTGGIGSHVTVFDPIQRSERVLRCFDSNSYLGLHQHPKVVQAVRRVTQQVGFGTPSAQLLCGTNRHLRELEQALCEFHGREATMIFPSGFAANAGAIRALVRSNDAVVRDQFAHASIHEACKTSDARMSKVFAHNRPASLASVLRRANAAGCSGKLAVTDGVFSMHGKIAPLPELVDVCRQNGARLMVDDAHGVGVIGENGGGIEEHFGMKGAVDVLMGTLSKALGSIGGYVCGDHDMITYLRWFAPAGLFTTSLPAPICAGVKAGLEIIRSEPEHRENLWRNIHHFVPALRQAGFIVPETASPIVTVYIGRQSLLWQVSRDLFDAGIKCGNVIYPAVGKNDCILRFTITATHSPEDIAFAVETLTRIGKRYNLLGRTREELQEIGRRTITVGVPLAS